MEYTLKRSKRAKYVRLSVQPGGAVILTAPLGISPQTIDHFVNKHIQWIKRSSHRMQAFTSLPVRGRRAYQKHKEDARVLVHERLLHWNRVYQYSFNRIAIKNTKRTWGSCSRKGNLNFSYALLFLPRELCDYVVVHELCHLKEHNHSPRFWALVASTIPDYSLRRKQLRRYIVR